MICLCVCNFEPAPFPSHQRLRGPRGPIVNLRPSSSTQNQTVQAPERLRRLFRWSRRAVISAPNLMDSCCFNPSTFSSSTVVTWKALESNALGSGHQEDPARLKSAEERNLKKLHIEFQTGYYNNLLQVYF